MQGQIALNGITYIWAVAGGILTVTAPDGRRQIAQLGGIMPEVLAQLLARELEGKKSK